MQVSLETLSALQRRLHIALPQEQIESAVEERAKRMTKTASIPGFRPGHAPLKLVLQRYGDTIRSEVISAKVDVSFNEALKLQSIPEESVVGYPEFGRKEGEPQPGFFEFVATFEVLPEIPETDFSAIQLERPVIQVEESDIDYTLDVVRRQRAIFTEVSRPTQMGDRIVLDFVGSINGEPFEGGTGENISLDIGAKQFLPDFENGTIGLEIDQPKTISVQFPEDYGNAELAGKTAEFVLTAKEIQEADLPELTDEFAQSLGVKSGSLDGLRAEVRKNLELDLKRRIKESIRTQVFDQLIQQHDFELPHLLVTQETQEIMRDAIKRLKEMGIQKPTPDMVKSEYFIDNAKKQLKVRLVISNLVKKLGLKPDQERTKQLVEEASLVYDDPKEVVEWVYQNPDQLQQFEASGVEESFMEYVLDHAKVTDKAQSLATFYGRSA
jgi:trigger factor